MVFALSAFGSFISYIYSAPPIKLKQNGWLGNYALGSSYISLPWWCGQAMFGELNIQARERFVFVFSAACIVRPAVGGAVGRPEEFSSSASVPWKGLVGCKPSGGAAAFLGTNHSECV